MYLSTYTFHFSICTSIYLFICSVRMFYLSISLFTHPCFIYQSVLLYLSSIQVLKRIMFTEEEKNLRTLDYRAQT